tara:strand:- start:17 stop:676 length:660 start_codon:yes stop_codon:yes gene_type:complete
MENKKQLSIRLTELEDKYGSNLTARRNKVSPYDPRTIQEINTGYMKGGDRFSGHHNFQVPYASYFEPYIGKENLVIVEVGILYGGGLAIWSELFPNSRIIGLDIDIQYTQQNLSNLESKGAIVSNIEIYEMDQFVDNKVLMGEILKGDSIDIIIDDGYHEREPIIKTIESVKDFLSEEFVYVVEDEDEAEYIQKMYPDWEVTKYVPQSMPVTMIKRSNG